MGGRYFKIWIYFSLSYSDLVGDKLKYLFSPSSVCFVRDSSWWEISPCPCLDPRAFHHISSHLSSWGGERKSGFDGHMAFIQAKPKHGLTIDYMKHYLLSFALSLPGSPFIWCTLILVSGMLVNNLDSSCLFGPLKILYRLWYYSPSTADWRDPIKLPLPHLEALLLFLIILLIFFNLFHFYHTISEMGMLELHRESKMQVQQGYIQWHNYSFSFGLYLSPNKF